MGLFFTLTKIAFWMLFSTATFRSHWGDSRGCRLAAGVLRGFSLLSYWNLYFLFPFLLNLYSLLTFLLKSLLSLISTFSLLFYWNLYLPLHLLYLLTPCTTFAPALHCQKQSCLASPNVTTHTKISKKSYAQNQTRHTPQPRRTQRLTPLPFATPRTEILLTEHTTVLFNGELPLDCSTTWLSYSMVSDLLITLPLNWGIIQWWVTSCEQFLDYSNTWLSYLSTALFQVFVTTEVSH